MTGRAIVLQGDALNLPLPDESVDLIITSPPYFALRSYQDDGKHYDGQIGSEPTPHAFLEALWKATAEMKRVLKPSGSIFVNLGDKYAGSGGHNNSNLSRLHQNYGRDESDRHRTADEGHRAARRTAPDRYNRESDGVPAKSLMLLPHRYAIGCIDRLGLIVRQDQVWSKPNGLPESVTDRTRRSHEYWFHMVKSPRYFSAVDEIREPHVRPKTAEEMARDCSTKRSSAVHSGNVGIARGGNRDDDGGTFTASNPLGKLPGSVWTIATEPLKVPADLGIDHFAAFPTEWPRRLILGWSPSGVCVECGEGRGPVCDRKPMVWEPSGRQNATQMGPRPTSGKMLEPPTTTITGYACACSEPTADTEPAVVLDPFGGTGTTALVAKTLGRVGISVDLSHDYCRLARWRVNESGHGRKALGRTWAERQEGLAL